jgi:RNA polymerase sigma-70 factor (ECF subfamily)
MHNCWSCLKTKQPAMMPSSTLSRNIKLKYTITYADWLLTMMMPMMWYKTFIKAWRGLPNFREDAQLFTWLYRIATNEALTFIKQKKSKYAIPFDEITADYTPALTQQGLTPGNIEMRLQQAIMQLPAQQRAVFNMRYYDELKYEDMATITGLTAGALKASYHHAVKKIEKFITNR